MSQGPLCLNLTKLFQKEVSQMANCNLSCVMQLLHNVYVKEILLFDLAVNFLYFISN